MKHVRQQVLYPLDRSITERTPIHRDDCQNDLYDYQAQDIRRMLQRSGRYILQYRWQLQELVLRIYLLYRNVLLPLYSRMFFCHHQTPRLVRQIPVPSQTTSSAKQAAPYLKPNTNQLDNNNKL